MNYLCLEITIKTELQGIINKCSYPKCHWSPDLPFDLSRVRDISVLEERKSGIFFFTISKIERIVTVFSDNILHVQTPMAFQQPYLSKLSETWVKLYTEWEKKNLYFLTKIQTQVFHEVSWKKTLELGMNKYICMRLHLLYLLWKM